MEEGYLKHTGVVGHCSGKASLTLSVIDHLGMFNLHFVQWSLAMNSRFVLGLNISMVPPTYITGIPGLQ